MVFNPRSQDSIYQSLKDRLTTNLSSLTNFVEGSFNYVWAHDTFGGHLHDLEVAMLAVQLSAYPDYAGGPVTESDLEAVGVSNIDPAEVNQYMDDEDLNQIGVIAGVARDPGQKSTGIVTFTVSSDAVTVEAGTEVATQPDSSGNYFSFFTDSEVSPASGSTTVDANVTAEAIGDEYNVGSDQVTYLPDAPPGVEAVTNAAAIDGGEDVESNDEYRERIKQSIVSTSGGGTTYGIEGYINQNVTNVQDVEVAEYPTASPPYADVVVNGGSDADVQDAIDKSHPSGVQHNLVRPTIYEINVDAEVEGPSSIDTNDVENAVTDYIDGLGLGERIVRDKVITKIMNADIEIEEVNYLDIEIDKETHTYQTGTSVYALDKPPWVSGDNISVTDASGDSYVKGTDYDVVDSGTDGNLDSIDWSIGGGNPAGGEDFYVTYEKQGNISIASTEVPSPKAITVTQSTS